MKFTLSLLLISFCAAYCLAQKIKESPVDLLKPIGKGYLTHESITAQTDKIYDKLVRIRRDFHENPELAGNEKRTKETITRYLLNLGLIVDTTIYSHSVLGILKGTKKGKNIAWRAEMDALPTDFHDPVDFRSKIKGVQHGCGHDVHMAIGLGIAEVLAKHRASLKGTVYFIFQPEEETFVGAKNMVAQALFDKIKPDEIYGLHVTALPTGQIMVRPNEMFAYQKRVRICLKNEISNEEIEILANSVRNSFFRGKANSKPWEMQHISDREVDLANPNTILNDFGFMDKHYDIYQENNEQVLET